ncbi:unnamed protein product [Urochloa humidicola]
MEFRFRAGDRRPRSPSPARFSSGPCDRRFSPRAGPSFHGEPPPPQPFEWELAAWRERIIGQEVERRLIEEACLIEAEVHRELALARARFQSVFGPLPFFGPQAPLPLPPPGAFFGPHGPFLPPVPPPVMPEGMHPIPNRPPPASLGESEGIDGRVGFEQSILVKRRRPLPPPKQKQKPKPKPKHKVEPREMEPSKSSEILSLETKVSGVKRKADVISASTKPTELQNVISATTEPPELQNAAGHWSCELCQVTATTRAELNKHLRGRRHWNKLPLMLVGMHPIPNGPPPASIGESEGFDGRVGFEQSILVKRGRPLPPPKHKVELCEIEPSKSSKILSPETKVSGVKRKADVISASTEPTELQNVISATTEPPELQNAARHRSCELCQVTATTRADLNKHLRGRRHLTKLVQCGDIQVIGDDKSDKGTGPTDVLRTIHILVNGEIHEVVQKSDLTLASTEPIEPQKATTEPTELKGKQRKHLTGKKHLKRKLWLCMVRAMQRQVQVLVTHLRKSTSWSMERCMKLFNKVTLYGVSAAVSGVSTPLPWLTICGARSTVH